MLFQPSHKRPRETIGTGAAVWLVLELLPFTRYCSSCRADNSQGAAVNNNVRVENRDEKHQTTPSLAR